MMTKCAQLDRNMNIINIWNFQQGLNGIPSRNIEIVIGHATPGNVNPISWEVYNHFIMNYRMFLLTFFGLDYTVRSISLVYASVLIVVSIILFSWVVLLT